MRDIVRKLALVTALVGVACGDEESTVDSTSDSGNAVSAFDGGASGDAATSVAQSLKVGCEAIEMAAPSDGIQIEFPLPVPAAQEREYCMLVLVDKDVNLNWTDGRFTKGSHHGTIYRTAYKDKIPTLAVTGETIVGADKPHVCQTPTALWDVRGVIGTGRPVTRATLDGNGNPEPGVKVLPDDVAVKIKKGDILLVNFHMINATEKALEACFKSNLHGIAADKVKYEAGLLFTYNVMITVPPMGESTARLACPVTKDVSLASAVSHMHARGDGYIANLLDKAPTDPTAKVVTELYKGTEWDDPKMRVFDQPLPLKAGQYIDYQCHYTNKEDRKVAQGFASSDEMCMFIGTYWPQDLDFETCVKAGSAAGGATAGIVYGDGKKSGADFLQCFWNLPERTFAGGFDDPKRYDTLACFTDTCPQASPGLNPYLTCLGDNTESCTTDCTDAQASFQASCATGACKEEYGSDGTNGTCAKEVGPKAVAACQKPAQVSAFKQSCIDGQCASACKANPAAAGCTSCVGTFDGSIFNTSCMNILVGACAQDQGKKIATECVTECFTECITQEVTSCVGNCLNNVTCGNEYKTLAAATCP